MYQLIDSVFTSGVVTLQLIGDSTGWGYQLSNIIIFIILQPGLILLFAWLWLRERRNKELILRRIPAVWRRIVRKDIGV